MPSEPWSGRDREQRARDILASIAAIHEFISGLDKTAFAQDRKTQSAVERELLTISEATAALRRLEEELPQADRMEKSHPHIPWAQISGIGNRLRHEYGRTDPHIIWDTISGRDLRDLAEALRTTYGFEKGV